MAIAVKRQLGSTPVWICARFVAPAGVMTVPEDKRLRALAGISKIAAGDSMPFSEFRSLMMFLNHLVPLCGTSRTAMYGLFWSLRGNPSPGILVTIASSVGLGSAARWVRVLATCPGALFFGADVEPPSGGVFFPMYIDSGKDDAPIPGLGGYVCGYWWSVSLVEAGLEFLDIPELEFVATGLGLIMGASLLANSGVSIALRSDALSSLSSLENDSAWSPEMQLIHAETRKLPAYVTLSPRIVASHVSGEANPAADFASRGIFCELDELCAALGVAPTRLKLGPGAFAFFTRVREGCRTLADRECARGPEFSNNSAGDGPTRSRLRTESISARSTPHAQVQSIPVMSLLSVVQLPAALLATSMHHTDLRKRRAMCTRGATGRRDLHQHTQRRRRYTPTRPLRG